MGGDQAAGAKKEKKKKSQRASVHGQESRETRRRPEKKSGAGGRGEGRAEGAHNQKDETCPLSTGGRARHVQLVRGEEGARLDARDRVVVGLALLVRLGAARGRGTGHARNVLRESRRSADAPAVPRGGQGLQRHLVHNHPHFLIARGLVVVEVLPSHSRARSAVSQPAPSPSTSSRGVSD